MEVKKSYILTEEEFGPLWEFINDDNITDIDINGQEVCIRDIYLKRKKTDVVLDKSFVDYFTNKVANAIGKQFNPREPVLESETDFLRFSIIHESQTLSGRSICIRKTLPKARISLESALKDGYMDEQTWNFLANCVKAKATIVVGGEMGVGKTEMVKFLCQCIGDSERIVTIEDSSELHYCELFPHRECVAMKTSGTMTYQDAIKASLRQDATRIILSEARSVEAKELIECVSTGMSGMSTIHTDDVRNIPSRILNMMPSRNDADRLSKDVFTYIDVGILLRAKELGNGKRKRFVDQIGVYVDRPQEDCLFALKYGKFVDDFVLPPKLANKFSNAGIEDPFIYKS